MLLNLMKFFYIHGFTLVATSSISHVFPCVGFASISFPLISVEETVAEPEIL